LIVWGMSLNNCYQEEAIIPGVVFLLIGLFLVVFCSQTSIIYKGVVPPGKYYIQAMNDTSTLNGKFFLASGNLEGGQIYTCYLNEAGSVNVYALYTFPADPNLSKIYEEDIDKPYVLVKAREKGDWIWGLGRGEVLEGYEFHIPYGSIMNRFQLDLEK